MRRRRLLLAGLTTVLVGCTTGLDLAGQDAAADASDAAAVEPPGRPAAPSTDPAAASAPTPDVSPDAPAPDRDRTDGDHAARSGSGSPGAEPLGVTDRVTITVLDGASGRP